MEEITSNKKMTYSVISALILVALAAAWWFFVHKKKKTTGGVAAEKVTIYGSIGCPYTVKQMEKYPDHTFVDCTSEKCPEFVTAYPTTKYPDGKIEVGFS